MQLGVKQGDPSSSLLFMLFVNDILSNINSDLDGIFTISELKLFLIMFADGQVLFSTSPTSLQLMLNDIETYCNTWKLKIKVNKTKVLIFEKSSRYIYYEFYIYNEKPEIVTSFKYSGISFFSKLAIGIGLKNVYQSMHLRRCTDYSLFFANMSLNRKTNANCLTNLLLRY